MFSIYTYIMYVPTYTKHLYIVVHILLYFCIPTEKKIEFHTREVDHKVFPKRFFFFKFYFIVMVRALRLVDPGILMRIKRSRFIYRYILAYTYLREFTFFFIFDFFPLLFLFCFCCQIFICNKHIVFMCEKIRQFVWYINSVFFCVGTVEKYLFDLFLCIF